MWKGMPVLCAAVFINALCVHQRSVCASVLVTAFVCTPCHVHPQGSRHTSDLDWSKLYGDMDPHGTYVKVRVFVCVCVCLCVFVLPFFTQAALFVIAESHDRGIASIRGALRDMLHMSILLFSLDDALCVVRVNTRLSCCFRWMMHCVWCGMGYTRLSCCFRWMMRCVWCGLHTSFLLFFVG